MKTGEYFACNLTYFMTTTDVLNTCYFEYNSQLIKMINFYRRRCYNLLSDLGPFRLMA